MACIRMSITVPKALKEQMKLHKGVNWSKVAADAFAETVEADKSASKYSFEAVTFVYCHEIAFRYWWDDGPCENDALIGILTEEVERRAKEMIAQEYVEGELNYCHNGHIAIRGHWRIKRDTL